LAVDVEPYNRAKRKNYVHVRSITAETVNGKMLSMLIDLSAKFEQLHREMRELKAKENESPLPRMQAESNQTSETQKMCYFCRKTRAFAQRF
jgi:hypothetical protein